MAAIWLLGCDAATSVARIILATVAYPIVLLREETRGGHATARFTAP